MADTLALLQQMGLPAVVSLKEAAHQIGLSYQTLLNQTSNHTCKLRTFKIGSRRVVHLVELADFINRFRREGSTPDPDLKRLAAVAPVRPKRGRPTKAVQVARRAEDGGGRC